MRLARRPSAVLRACGVPGPRPAVAGRLPQLCGGQRCQSAAAATLRVVGPRREFLRAAGAPVRRRRAPSIVRAAPHDFPLADARYAATARAERRGGRVAARAARLGARRRPGRGRAQVALLRPRQADAPGRPGAWVVRSTSGLRELICAPPRWLAGYLRAVGRPTAREQGLRARAGRRREGSSQPWLRFGELTVRGSPRARGGGGGGAFRVLHSGCSFCRVSEVWVQSA
jgi:hypothetical protein